MPSKIEEAVAKLAESPFDGETFPYAFWEAFGNKATTLKRLKTGSTNESDLAGGDKNPRKKKPQTLSGSRLEK